MRTAILYNFLIEANIMASIAIVLMMILRKTMRRSLGNGCICFGWLLVALRLLLPLSFANPIIHTIRSPFAPDVAIRPIAGQILVRTRDAVEAADSVLWRSGIDVAANAARGVRDSFDYGTIGTHLMKIYLLGMALITAWFILSNVYFRLKLRAGRIEKISGKLLDEYNAICKERHVKPVPVCYTDPLPSACLVGVFRPFIALPLTAAPKEVSNVLTHEICHMRNHDHLWALLRMVCCIVHWFNPLVWIAADMSRTDTELRCDDRVVAPMDQEQKQAYANVLVLAASRRTAPGVTVLATGMTMTGRRLKTRVMTVLQGAKPMRWLSLSFMLIASMCLIGAFATSEAYPIQIDPSLNSTPWSEFRTTQYMHPTFVKGEDGSEYAFIMYQKLENNGRPLPVDSGVMSADDALGFALTGIEEKYGVDKGTMSEYPVSYGYRNLENNWAEQPYWQFDFVTKDYNDFYEVLVNADNGKLIYIAEPGEGNG